MCYTDPSRNISVGDTKAEMEVMARNQAGAAGASRVTCHKSRVTCHESRVTCDALQMTRTRTALCTTARQSTS